MKKFGYTIAAFTLAIVLFNIVQTSMVLHLLKRDYPFPKRGSVKWIKRKEGANTLVVGCSNVQHNIDIPRVQDSLAVDFFYFSGADNSSLLRFFIDQELTAGYKNIILYVPYHMLQSSKAFRQSDYHYANIACYEYSLNVLKRNPAMLFFAWPSYYYSIKRSRTPDHESEYIVSYDRKIDSLLSHPGSYRNCDLPFVKEKHVFALPQYVPEDEEFVNSLVDRGQHLYIMFPPLPDIPENKFLPGDIPDAFKSIDRLNQPRVLDSTLFYDQWYHLDYCGRNIETEVLIKLIKEKVVL